MLRCTAWLFLRLPFIGFVVAVVSEDCGSSSSCAVPASSDAFASLQVSQHEATHDGQTEFVTYKYYKNGTSELIPEVNTTNASTEGTATEVPTNTTPGIPPIPPELLQATESTKLHEGFPWPWKIWERLRIKQAIDGARRERLRGCHPGDFAFMFTNSASNDGNGSTVTGCISGLRCPQVAGQASSVRVVTNEVGSGIGEFFQDGVLNNFTSDAHCNMIAFEFASFFPPMLSASLVFLDFLDPRGCAGLGSDSLAAFVLCGGPDGQPVFHYISS